MVGVLGTVGRKTRRANGIALSPELPAPVLKPQTAVTFQTWHESTIDSGRLALRKTHPAQRLKTGAVNVRQKENPGHAEFFTLPIANPGSLW